MEEYSKRSLLLGHSEFGSNGLADLFSNYALPKLRNRKLDLKSLG
jgi:hypothetical protein